MAYLLAYLGLETLLAVACVAVFYKRRHVLLPLIRYHLIGFLGTERRLSVLDERIDERLGQVEWAAKKSYRSAVAAHRRIAKLETPTVPKTVTWDQLQNQ